MRHRGLRHRWRRSPQRWGVIPGAVSLMLITLSCFNSRIPFRGSITRALTRMTAGHALALHLKKRVPPNGHLSSINIGSCPPFELGDPSKESGMAPTGLFEHHDVAQFD